MYKMERITYAPHTKQAFGEREIEAVMQCLKDGWLAGIGPKTEEFERKVAAYFGKKHGLFVNSGSSAVLLALDAAGVGPGDEVVTPACTFATTVAPIVQLGATPVFCDVQLQAYVPSVDQIMEKVTPKTKCILVPNLVGNKMDWAQLRARTSLLLIEDSADCMTHTPETDMVTTSFYASHMITAGGSGGMVMFNDTKHLKRATMMRDWGRIGDNSEVVTERFAHEIDGIPYDYKFLYGALGYNFRSSEMNAAFGLAQLERIDGIAAKRRALFDTYMTTLSGVPELQLPNDAGKCNWLAFPLTLSNASPRTRLQVLTELEDAGIQTRVLFSGNITRHPAYRQYLTEFPNTTLLYVTTGSYSADTDKTYSAKHLDWGVDVSRAIMSEADKRAPAYKPTFMVMGASGFLGSWAVHYLKKQGYGVVESSVRMEDRCALKEELVKVNPGYVICAAGVAGKPNIGWCESHPMDTLRANVVGVLNVVDVCKSLNKHVTLFGSGGIFEYDEAHPEGSGKTFAESDVGNAQQPGMYVRARMLLEELLKEVSDHALYLRILYPVSSDLNPQGLIGKLLGFKSVHAVPTSVTVIDDLFPLLSTLSEKRVTGILNFVNSGCIKYPDVLEACKTIPSVVDSLGKARAAAHLATDALAAATGSVIPYAHTSIMNICKHV